VVEKELRYAFEEVHCGRWPNCAGRDCDCFDKNYSAVLVLSTLIRNFIEAGASREIITFVRWRAHTLYGVLPTQHRISRYTRTGGALCLLGECLDDDEVA